MRGALLATATAAKSGSTVTATVNGVTTTIQVARDVTVAAGDVLVVQQVGALWFALGRAFSAAPPTPVDSNDSAPDPNETVTTGSLVVSPVETRSYRNSSWRTDNTDVYHGEYGGWGNHTGVAFFGTKPQSLKGATVTSATVRVKRPSGTGSTYAAVGTTIWLVTEKTRPSGAPTRTSSTAGPSIAAGKETTFTIPTSWAQQMVDGTAGAIGFFDSDGSPYIIFAGRGSWSPAFTLTINWQRG